MPILSRCLRAGGVAVIEKLTAVIAA